MRRGDGGHSCPLRGRGARAAADKKNVNPKAPFYGGEKSLRATSSLASQYLSQQAFGGATRSSAEKKEECVGLLLPCCVMFKWFRPTESHTIYGKRTKPITLSDQFKGADQFPGTSKAIRAAPGAKTNVFPDDKQEEEHIEEEERQVSGPGRCFLLPAPMTTTFRIAPMCFMHTTGCIRMPASQAMDPLTGSHIHASPLHLLCRPAAHRSINREEDPANSSTRSSPDDHHHDDPFCFWPPPQPAPAARGGGAARGARQRLSVHGGAAGHPEEGGCVAPFAVGLLCVGRIDDRWIDDGVGM